MSLNPRKSELRPDMASVIAKLHEEGLELANTYDERFDKKGRTIDEALDVIGCFMYAVDHMEPDEARKFLSHVQRVATQRDARNSHRLAGYVPQASAFIEMLSVRSQRRSATEVQ